MDTDMMLRWFKATILPYTKGRRSLLLIDSFSAHEAEVLLDLAQFNNVDIIIIPGGCTSKIQPLDVCLNKPFKSILKKSWLDYIGSLVKTDPNPSKLATPSKELLCKWIKQGLDYLEQKQAMVKKSFLVCGISNAIDGSENQFIHCAKELPNLQLPFVDEATNDLFLSEDEDEASGDEDEASASDVDSDE